MLSLAEQKQELIARWRREGFPEALLKAFAKVPREEFMPAALRDQAYIDQPFPIGHEQTISQPTTVLIMLGLLEVSPRQKILEIGVGSGYASALLAASGCEVVGIEIVPELAVSAARALGKLGYDTSVKIHASDGGGGWEEGAPYDRILISTAPPDVPRHLFWQLKNGGILVAPVGRVEQRMIVAKKRKEGEVTEEDHGAFLFTPLKGKWGMEGDNKVPGLPFV